MYSFLRAVRGPVSVMAVFAFSINGLQGAGESLPAPYNEPDFIKWSLTQGGLVAVLLTVLWSYRRDLGGVIKRSEVREKVLMEFIQKSTEALTKMSAAVGQCPFQPKGKFGSGHED